MRRFECEHESDVLSAVYTNRWPAQVSESLREHVGADAALDDVLAVASAFEADVDLARSHAPVPDASIVWWRAQLRARQAATREVVRPITIAQAIGFAAAVGVLGAIFGATATWFQETLRWMGGAVRSSISMPALPAAPEGLAATLSGYAFLAGALMIFFALASLAVYGAVRATESDA